MREINEEGLTRVFLVTNPLRRNDSLFRELHKSFTKDNIDHGLLRETISIFGNKLDPPLYYFIRFDVPVTGTSGYKTYDLYRYVSDLEIIEAKDITNLKRR